jgi:hypothetical protein
VHLAHPRVKNDERDAADRADVLRMGLLPEAWIVPPRVRELTRCSAKLMGLRTSSKDPVHAVLAKLDIPAS